MVRLLTLVLAALLDESTVVGGEFVHLVQPGESLTIVGARYGVSVKHLAAVNSMSSETRLTLGQELKVQNRHIVPDGPWQGIVINAPQRMLFVFSEGRIVAHYPVGLGSRAWPTVLGNFEIVRKEENPTWDVPTSIQAEMLRKGQPIQTKVPPSPENPLGSYYLALSAPGFGIHGTNTPESVYGFQTHGCIRLHPDDIADLFSRVSVGMPVHIIYEPVLVSFSDGKLYVEVHDDVYRKGFDAMKILEETLRQIRPMLDWREVVQTAADRVGVARPLTIIRRTSIRRTSGDFAQ